MRPAGEDVEGLDEDRAARVDRARAAASSALSTET